MRSKRMAAAVVAAAALAAVPVAAAGMLHPQLGARLSGMGETGIVNLQAHAKTHQLCWTFDLHVMHVLGATIRDAHGMKVASLGHMYRAKGCAMVSKQSLALIETNRRAWPEACGRAVARTSWIRTPAQWTLSTLQPVTQWKFETCSTRGRARSWWYVSETGWSTRPPTSSRQVAGSKAGMWPEIV